MSAASTKSSSYTMNSNQIASVEYYAEQAVPYLSQYDDAPSWARAYSRQYFHDVDKTVGFLPVYHTLLKYAASTPKTQDHPLLPTPQNQSETFEVKMEKLFKYAWPLRSEYRDLERWSKVQAAQWQAKGNVDYKLALVSAKLLQMATQKLKEDQKPKLTFKNDFDQMADVALGDVKHFDCPESWARATARNFFHQFNKTTPFITIYTALLKKNEEVEEEEASESSSEYSDSEEDDETYVTESEDESEDESLADDEDDEDDESYEESEDEEEDDNETLSYTDEEDYVPVSIVEKDRAKAKEDAHQGRLALNRFMFKQYNEWYDAFKQEAEEDDQDLSANDRFSWHCAKILGKKVDMSAEELQPVVGAWLELHHEHLN